MQYYILLFIMYYCFTFAWWQPDRCKTIQIFKIIFECIQTYRQNAVIGPRYKIRNSLWNINIFSTQITEFFREYLNACLFSNFVLPTVNGKRVDFLVGVQMRTPEVVLLKNRHCQCQYVVPIFFFFSKLDMPAKIDIGFVLFCNCK